MINVKAVRKLNSIRLPGEHCRFAGPFRVPAGYLEIAGLHKPKFGTPYITWQFGPATKAALKEAYRIRKSQECDE